MEFWNVIAAGGAAWLPGLLFHARGGAWRAALTGTRKPRPRLPLMIGSLAGLILVAGFLRHVFFVSGLISNVILGAVAGLGVGLFFIAPWLWILNLAEGRSFRLTMLDGGYASLATGLMSALLLAF